MSGIYNFFLKVMKSWWYKHRHIMNECLEIRSVGDDCQDGCQEDECKAGNLSAMLMKAPPKMFPGREAAMDEAPEIVIGWNG